MLRKTLSSTLELASYRYCCMIDAVRNYWTGRLPRCDQKISCFVHGPQHRTTVHDGQSRPHVVREQKNSIFGSKAHDTQQI
jgi:hypothetical protein